MVEMTIYGYTRISRSSQNQERQNRNIIAEYPTAKIYEEVFSSMTTDRPEFNKVLKRLKEGDTLVFDSVSRMSRNAKEGFELYKELIDKGVELVFLKEPYINSTVYKMASSNKIQETGNEIADKYINTTNEVIELIAQQQIQIAFNQAEKEIMDIRERTKEGLKTARINGKVLGRKVGAKVKTKKGEELKEVIVKYSKEFDGNMKDKDIIEWKKCSKATYYKYKQILMAERIERQMLN